MLSQLVGEDVADRRRPRTRPTERWSPRPPSRPARSEARREHHVGHDRRHAEDRVLVEREVAQPARPERLDVEQGRRRRGERLRVAGPAEPLVPLRAVGRAPTRSCRAATRRRSRAAGSGARPSTRSVPRRGVSLLIATNSASSSSASVSTSAYRKPWNVKAARASTRRRRRGCRCRSPWRERSDRVWSEPSGSRTSACRTITWAPADPRTRSRDEPGDVLAAVELADAVPSARSPDRARHDGADRRRDAGLDDRRGRPDTTAAGRQPAASKPGTVPADRVELAQVDDAAVVQVGALDLARRGLPRVVGRDRPSSRRPASCISSWATRPSSWP